MAKQCIGCKREISTGILICPFCGANQSFFQYYLKSFVLFLLIVISAIIAGYYLVNQSVAQAKLELEQSHERQLNQAEEKIQRLETALLDSQKQLRAAQLEIQTSLENQTANADQAGALEAELNQKLKNAQADAKRQQDRAGWLSRENAKLKTEIETLKQQLAGLQNLPTPVPAQPDPIPVNEQVSENIDSSVRNE